MIINLLKGKRLWLQNVNHSYRWKDMQYKIMVRLCDERGDKFFGKGVAELLVNIDREGSLNLASKQMGIAYSKAWRILHTAEDTLGYALVEKKSGGRNGGGSVLTTQGREFLELYQKLDREIHESVDQIFQKYFGNEGK